MTIQTEVETSEHLKAAVYGANDGIITTFAVVAGVAGANLSTSVVLILGIANMVADGISMSLSDYLAERTQRRYWTNHKQKPIFDLSVWHGPTITFFAFNAAGALPLSPYLLRFLNISVPNPFLFSIITTAFTLFAVGSLRTFVTRGVWWKNGFEMLIVGTLAAFAAYTLGGFIESLII